MSNAHPIRRRMLLAGAAGLTTAAATVALARTAHAADPAVLRAVPEPDIDSCAEWGARLPSGDITVLPDQPNKIIVHHTVTANTSDFSRAQAHAHARWVQDLHMDDNGWSDTGYHFINSRGGWITEGRHESLATLTQGNGLVLGAHTVDDGQNYEAIGISNEGSYHDGAVPPAAQWDTLVVMCAYVCAQYGIDPNEIYGHKDFGDTLCPGIFHDRLPRLRDEVAEAMTA